MNFPVEIVIALLSAGIALAGYHFGRRKTRAETENIDVETIDLLRKTVNELVKEVDDLRRRVYALEAERDTNRHTIEGLRSWGRRLLAWLKSQNLTGYPEPEAGLLDTDPNIKAVGK